MPVHALAQVELDVDRDLAGDQPPDHGQPEPQEPGADDRQRQRQQRRRDRSSSIALTAAPTSSGIRTVIPIATQAKTSDQITVRRYGRRKPSSRRKVRIHIDYTK